MQTDSKTSQQHRSTRQPLFWVCIACGILVLLFLSYMGISSFHQATDSRRKPKVEVDISSLEAQIDLYHKQCGAYPSSLDDLLGTYSSEKDITGDGIVDSKDVYGPWLKFIPMQTNGMPYTYNHQTGKVSAN